MSKPAAIEGSLVDARNIAVHKSMRLSIDVPVEDAQKGLAAFGWPTMADPVPVAIARLIPQSNLKETLRRSVEHEKAKKSWDQLTYAQQAGIASNEKGFWAFMNETYRYNCQSPEDAAEAIREICGVTSRKDIAASEDAIRTWTTLYDNYRLWLQAPEVAAHHNTARHAISSPVTTYDSTPCYDTTQRTRNK